MALVATIERDVIAAMKARDAFALETLRFAKSALANAAIEARVPASELSDDQAMAVLRSLDKRLRDSVDAYEKGGRPELAANETAQRKIIASYLPAPLTDEELDAMAAAVVAETGVAGPAGFGAAMKELTARAAGRADGQRASAAVKKALGTP